MITIKSLKINKFRAFHPGEEIVFRKPITLIAGLNGTSKSTILGMICQPIGFPSVGKESKYTTNYSGIALNEKRTLFGSSFSTKLSEVFRLSKEHDKPKEHDYYLYLDGPDSLFQKGIKEKGLHVISGDRGGDEAGQLRFVVNGSKTLGEGNFPHPVVYLGLDRLRPLAMFDAVGMRSVEGGEYNRFRKDWVHIYKQVMVCGPAEEIDTVLLDIEKGGKHKYQSIKTGAFDGEAASAGQDNLGQIITALLSFKKLKSDLGERYQGGVMLIDEMDATLHPYAQKELLRVFIEMAQQLSIQIVATTHSMDLLELASRDFRNHVELAYLALGQSDGLVRVFNDKTYDEIRYELSLVAPECKVKDSARTSKTTVIFEDCVAAAYFNRVTKNIFRKYIHVYNTERDNSNTCMPNSILSDIAKYLVTKKIPEFASAIYVLDQDSIEMKKKARSKILLCLPGVSFIEKQIYDSLAQKSSDESFWTRQGISFRDCFRAYNDIEGADEDGKEKKIKYKQWFRRLHKRKAFGTDDSRAMDVWINENQESCKKFCLDMVNALRSVSHPISQKDQEELQKKIVQKFLKR